MADRSPRRPTSAIDKAEALFKQATAKAPEARPKPVVAPVGKESITIRVDRDVLAHFQEDGPGWQDRLNEALRRAAGLA
ncbi:MAG TPA: BrnA antitoxin family protein [Devosiaceae bacterium]|jgi:uncharacterized protein (DUF4415 family)|nr:BrnA antitoxin family protein [Devosiaceae bacterium]